MINNATVTGGSGGGGGAKEYHVTLSARNTTMTVPNFAENLEDIGVITGKMTAVPSSMIDFMPIAPKPEESGTTDYSYYYIDLANNSSTFGSKLQTSKESNTLKLYITGGEYFYSGLWTITVYMK